MIKYFKINQSTENTLLTVHNNLASDGNTGLIICEDNRRLYYQDSNNLYAPILVGTSNYWEIVSDSDSEIQVLEIGKKYIRTGTHQSFTLPTNEYAQAVGDTIEFFNKNNENLVIKNGLSSFLEESNTSGHYYRFYWDGTDWNELRENNTLPSADTEGNWGITTVESSYVSEVISSSPYPIAASAVYEYINNLDLSSGGGGGSLEGALSAVQFNGTIYSDISGDATAHLGEGYIQVLSATEGQYLKKTENGWETDAGITTLTGTYTSADIVNSDYLQIQNTAIPVMIQTTNGNLYPIEKGSLTRNSGHFLIDTRPYLSYDNEETFTGQWIIYYGAGINDLYTTANTIIEQTVSATPFNIRFSEADVHVLTITTNETVTLTNSDLAVGHGMIIKLINNSGTTVMFGGHTLVAATGSYSFSIFNFGTGAEQVGEVTIVY